MGLSNGILYVKWNNNNSMSQENKLTKTAEFLLPLTKVAYEEFTYAKPSFFDPIPSTRFYNAYLYDTDNPMYKENHICLVHNNVQDVRYPYFENRIVNHKNFIDGYEIPNTKYSIKIFKIDDSYQKDYELLIKGQYSKISEEALQQITTNTFGGDKTAIKVKQVVKKSPILKKAIEERIGKTILEHEEIWGLFIEEHEIFNNKVRKLLTDYKLEPSEDF